MTRLLSSSIIVFSLTASLALAAPSAATYDAYHVGNSHTDSIRNWIKPFAIQGGKSYDIGFQTIPGASLNWNYNNPGGFGTPYTTALVATNSWEAVVFQIYGGIDGEIFAAKQLYAMALAGNPQATVFLYNVFPNKDAWNNPPFERTLAAAEQAADALAAAYPNAPQPRIVPVGELLIQLGIAATNGQIPGISSHYDFFASAAGDSHLNSLGQYVGVLAHYACFFREDIRNFPDTVMNGGNVLVSIPPATGPALRAKMWDFLSSYPRTGISTVLSIRAKALPVAISGVPFSSQIQSDNGIGAVTWSIVSGSLPNGLSLNTSSGLISGTPGQTVGSFAFTLRARDSQNTTAEREFTLFLEADTEPVITLGDLPTAQMGEPYNIALPVTGGNAPFAWKFLSGALPPGLEINANGDLFGTPSKEGSYSFEVEVSELIGGYSDVGAASLTLQVSPPNERTLITPRTLDPINVLAGGAEAVWEDFIEVGKVISESAQHTAAFSLLWDNYDLWALVDVFDNTPNASGLAIANSDSVDIFLDAFHNREVVYNEDDRHITVTRDGRLIEPSLRTAGIRHGVFAFDGGYSVIVAVPWANLAIEPYPGQSLGLDIGVNDNTGTGAVTGKRVWWGNANNPGTTLHFGNVLLGNATVGTQLGFPAAPNTFTATPTGDSSIRLDWTYTSPATAEEWVVWRATGPGAFSYLTTLSGNLRTYTNAGLAVETVYRYRIQARNRTADGPWSHIAGAKTAPRQPFLEANGLIIMEAENYETLLPRSDPTPYRVSTSDAGFSGLGYIDTANNSTQNSTDAAGWNAATEVIYRFIVPTTGTYGVRIRLLAPTGGDDSTFLGLNGVQIPGSQFANTSASWTWSSQVNLGTLEAGTHTLHLRKREDGQRIDRIAVVRSGANAPSGSAIGPAESLRGPAAGSPLPNTPATPSNGTGADPQTEYPLSWAASTGALAYHLERATDSGVFVRVASLAPDSLSFTDRNLMPGTSYRYRIVAQNLSGETAGEAFTIETAAPPSLTLKTEGSALKIEVPTQEGYIYAIEQSLDLMEWNPLQTITNTTGVTTIEAGDASNQPLFYRLILRRN